MRLLSSAVERTAFARSVTGSIPVEVIMMNTEADTFNENLQTLPLVKTYQQLIKKSQNSKHYTIYELKFCVHAQEQLTDIPNINVLCARMPIITMTDPMLLNALRTAPQLAPKLVEGTIVGFLRDYEYGIIPYYYYRKIK